MAKGPNVVVIYGTVAAVDSWDTATQRYQEKSSGTVTAGGGTQTNSTDASRWIDTLGYRSATVFVSATAAAGANQNWDLVVTVKTLPQAKGTPLALTAASGAIGTISEATSLPFADSATYTRAATTALQNTGNLVMDRFLEVVWSVTNDAVADNVTVTFMLLVLLHD